MDESNKRIDYVDVLRFIGILSMIIGHLEIGGTKADHIIHAFHMPIFFIISGYFYYEGEWQNQILRKIRTILIPYAVFGLFHYVIWIALNFRTTANIFRPLQCLLVDCTSLDMPIAGALWFLPCLFWAEALYLLIEKTLGGYRCIPIILIALLGNLWGNIFTFRLPLALDSAFVGLGLFYIGHLMKRIDFTNLMNKIPFAVKILLLVFDIISIMKNGYVNMRTANYGVIPLFWLNAVLSTILLWDISRKIWDTLNSRKLGKRICCYICSVGRNSIIYLSFNQLAIFIATSIIIILGLRQYTGFVSIEKYVTLFLVMIILFVSEKIFTKTKLRQIIGK